MERDSRTCGGDSTEAAYIGEIETGEIGSARRSLFLMTVSAAPDQSAAGMTLGGRPAQSVPPAPDPLGSNQHPGPIAGSDPRTWVSRFGDELYGFALARLNCPEDAADAVQEALLAAVRVRDSFDGRSLESTWLFGILRHKVIDLLRMRSRDAAWSARVKETLEHEAAARERRPGNRAGDWTELPSDPVEYEEALKTLESAITELPDVMRQAFMLAEVDQLPGTEVRTILSLTASNFWTLMHRARIRLRRELENAWQAKETRS